MVTNVKIIGKAQYKVLGTEENRLYDKQCPQCGRYEMIGNWSHKLHKNNNIMKCGFIDCKYEGKAK